jgi:hypothetical protein
MMERISRKSSSSVGSEKMERVDEGQGKMERYCSTGQSPQRAIAPTKEVEEAYHSGEGNLTVGEVFTYAPISWRILIILLT